MKKYLLLLLLIIVLPLSSCIEPSGGSTVPEPDDPIEDNKIHQDLTIDVEMHKLFTGVDPYTEYQTQYIYIGYWPQREIIDTDTLAAVEKIKTVNDRGYIEYKGMEILKYTVVNNWIYAEDEQSGSEIFVNATGYEPEQTYYFLVEPVLWKVMQYNSFTKQAILITDNIIDSRCYQPLKGSRIINDDTIYASNYEYSQIREWLNNDFFNLCFTSEEKAMIEPTLCQNKCVCQYLPGEFVNNPTTDNVWLLSYQQVTSQTYGFKNDGTCDVTRYAKATNYANARGLIKHTVDQYITSIWLIRTAYEYSREYIAYVGYDGLGQKTFYPDAENVGTRPAITITIPE